MSLPYGFKAKSNRIAVGLRHQMGLRSSDPIDLHDLAETRLGLRVVPITVFTKVCPEHVTRLLMADKGAFSASLLQVGNRRVILLNDGHSPRRQNSNLAHEIAHALLAHPSTQPFDHTGCRNFDEDMEDQANCLAGHVLIPNEAAQQIVWSGRDPEAVCDDYGVSRQMLEYRLNTSGARKRRSRWQRSWATRTSL